MKQLTNSDKGTMKSTNDKNQQSGFLIVDKQMAAKHGIEVAGYMANLMDKYIYFRERFPENDGEFFIKYHDQATLTGWTKHVLSKLKHYCMEQGWISTRIRGFPPKEWYEINLQHPDIQSLVKNFNRHWLKNLTAIGQKSEPIYKENKYKETKFKDVVVPASDSGNDSDKISTSGETENSSPGQKKITPGLFNQFWKMYPRKVEKGKAWTIWKRICDKSPDQRPTWNEIRGAIYQQKRSERWQDKDYIPYPTTWLNQSRWMDDPKEMFVPKKESEQFKRKHGTMKQTNYDKKESIKMNIRH